MMTKRTCIEYIAGRLVELHQDPEYKNPKKHCKMLESLENECKDYCQVGNRFSDRAFYDMWDRAIDLAEYMETGRRRLA